MEPTLEIGDRVLVNKLSYDLHDLHRGDIVVFESGPNPIWHRVGIEDLVKRVIALPGRRSRSARPTGSASTARSSTRATSRRTCAPTSKWTESFPSIDGKLVCDAESPPATCKVPAGKVFVMGDNRINSSDARDHGPIKESSIVGRVFLRIWPPGRIGFM